MAQLLSNLGKRGVNLNLLTMKVDIEDTTYLSKYFAVSEFNTIFTAGKNSIAFNGSSLLKSGSEIQVQCLDSHGNSLYLEYPKSKTQFIDVANFVIALHVYNENYNGPGKLILVGTSTKGEIIRWTSNISIDKTLPNISKTRFYSTPTIEARPLLYPVIDSAEAIKLTSTIIFTGSFYSNALVPNRDTLQSYINPKKMDTDYRLFYNDPNTTLQPKTYPTTSFNTQMEGQTISIITSIIQQPFSYVENIIQTSASFTIKKVIDDTSIQLSEPFFFTVGKDNVVSNINLGQFTSSYKWVAYNTGADIYLSYPEKGNTIYFKESYAEVVYRNIRTFSGFVARHKLYRKSLIYPGDYTLISDEPLGIRELLVDPITPNKTYALMGEFYNQHHINKYWFTSSNSMGLSHSVSPYINAMTIGKTNQSSFDELDGTKYVIVKSDSIVTFTTPNDEVYRPYNETEFNDLQGLSYNSNFIDLKAGSLYVLSMNLSIEKELTNPNAKLSFYFTSSTPNITKEKTFIPTFGMKLGEFEISDYVSVKNYSDKQMLYFTPLEDYYGTMVIVPYQCTTTLSNISLGVYGDYGFSPDTLVTKIPFNVKVAGELFQLKAELFDINSTLVYSDLKIVQAFDANGESLVTYIPPLSSISTTSTRTTRVMAAMPANSETHTNASTYYTDIVDVSVIPTNNDGIVTTDDYISVTTTPDDITFHNGHAIAVHYSGSVEHLSGRRIYVDAANVKHVYQ
jgi:hypothetical protein